MTYRGKWAIVTGASAGIGAVFAKELATRGANVALVARRKDRLDALAMELKRDYAVDARALAADLADPAAPDEIFKALEGDGAAIDILVNNAGYGLPGAYLQNSWEQHRDFLEVMVTSYAHFVRLAMPGMVERGYGRIIQVASLAGLLPGSAGHTMYGASKAFLISFSQSLAAEGEASGVKVSALCPGFTYSEFHDVNATRGLVSQLPKYMFMEPGPVVRGAIDALERGEVVYVPGAWNKWVAWLAKAMPRSMAMAMVRNQSKRFRRQERQAPTGR